MLTQFVIIFSLINSCIELEISAPSFPAIMEYFGVSENEVGLTITYNLVSFCIGSIIYGPLSERFGRRPIMVIGNGILAIGAWGCVFAPSMEFLLASRFIQGFGAATAAVLSTAIIADIYDYKRATKLYGIMGATFTSIMSLSPIIGAALTYYIGWRGNYAFVAIICIISFLLIAFLLPETLEKAKRKKSLDLKNIGKDYKQLFTSTEFLAASITPSLLYCTYLSFIALAPFIYMDVYKLSLALYSIHQAIAVFSFAVTSVIAGMVTNRFGVKNMLVFANLTYMFGAIIMVLANNQYLYTGGVSIAYVGSALIYPIIFAYSMQIFPIIKGTASSAIMSMRYLICSIGTSLAILIYSGNPEVLGIYALIVSFIISAMCFYLLKFGNLE